MSRDESNRRGLEPLAKIVSWATCGVDPALMGSGPIPASKKALEKAGWNIKDLDLVEQTHRKWVGEIIDLANFKYCYFVNGTTDAIHHWKIIEQREWQKLEGEYEYPDAIGPWGDVCCDVPGQYMGEDGRSAIPAVVDPNKPIFISIPSSADGNFFKPKLSKDVPVLLDCTYIGSTNIQRIDIPEGTEQVFFSFSKGYIATRF